MPYHIKDGGVWKQGQAKWVKDGGVWKEVQDGWIKDAGVWKPYYKTPVYEEHFTSDNGGWTHSTGDVYWDGADEIWIGDGGNAGTGRSPTIAWRANYHRRFYLAFVVDARYDDSTGSNFEIGFYKADNTLLNKLTVYYVWKFAGLAWDRTYKLYWNNSLLYEPGSEGSYIVEGTWDVNGNLTLYADGPGFNQVFSSQIWDYLSQEVAYVQGSIDGHRLKIGSVVCGESEG